MSREIRNVAKNWQHPKRESTGRYIPLYDEYYGDAIEEWIKNHKLWQKGKHPDQKEEGLGDSKFYAEWASTPDIERYRMVKWTEEAACCFQVYETVSEGTPQSPIFETLAALEDWLVETAKVINITIGVSDKGFSMNFAIVCKNGKEMYNMNLRELFPSKQALLDSL